jgi:ABC-2 type transport system permease protein
MNIVSQIRSYFEGLLKYKWLLKELVSRDLKVKYKRSILGYAWSLLSPLLMMLVMTAVFSHIFRFNIPNFPVYFLCGNVVFTFFSESTSMAMTSILQGAGLIKKVYIPKFIFPLSKIISSFVNLMYSLIAVVIIILITKTPVSWTVLLLPIPLIYLFLISLGMGLFVTVLATYFRDMLYLYGIFTMALMYLTPIFYPVEMLPPQILMVVKFNPLYHVVDYFRQVILWGTVPSFRDNFVCIMFCVLFMAIGLIAFKKKQDKFFLYI